MPKESTLKRKCTALVRERGGWAKSVPGGLMGAGHPDFYFWYRGIGGGIETKQPKGKLTTLQRETLLGIKRAGGVAKVVRHVSRMAAILDAIDRKFDGTHR